MVFLGLTLSPSPPVRTVGYLTAVGIAVSFLLCLTLLPLLLVLFDPQRTADRRCASFPDVLAGFVERRRTLIILSFLALSIPAVWGAAHNRINDNVTAYFPESHAIHKDTKLVENRLSGINELLYSLDTGQRNGMFQVDAVAAVSRFSAWLRSHPDVIRVTSIADVPAIRTATQEGRLQDRLEFYRRQVESDSADNTLLALEVSDDYSAKTSASLTRRLLPLSTGFR